MAALGPEGLTCHHPSTLPTENTFMTNLEGKQGWHVLENRLGARMRPYPHSHHHPQLCTSHQGLERQALTLSPGIEAIQILLP